MANIKGIVCGEYEAIHCEKLATFMKQFNRENRLRYKELSQPFLFSDDFYSFLAYQWLTPDCNSAIGHEYWEKQRRLMMSDTIKQRIERLGALSGQEIAKNIIEIAERLKGNFAPIKEVFDQRKGPWVMRDYSGNEDLSVRAVLLSMAWTTLNPYLMNTPIGNRRIEEIKTAAELLGVPFTNIGPLSEIEDALFGAV